MSSEPKPEANQSPAELLATPIQYLKGIGPKRQPLMERLELNYARDLLFFFPRSYQNMSELRELDQLEEGVSASVVGVIDEVDLRNTGPGKSILGMLVRCGTKYLRAIWFNQGYLREKFQPGRRVMLSGEPKLQGIRWEMTHPRVEFLADDEDVPSGRILPVYSLTDGINQTQMRQKISVCFYLFIRFIPTFC